MSQALKLHGDTDSHLVKYVDAEDPNITYDTDTVVDGNTYTLHDLDGVTVDHYEVNGQNYQPEESIGAVTSDVTVKVYLKPTEHTVKYVNKDDHETVYKTDTAYEGTDYKVIALTNVNVDKYYYEGVEKTVGDNLGNITEDILIEVTLKPDTVSITYVNKFDGEKVYTVATENYGAEHTLLSLSGVTVHHYEYEEQTDLHPTDKIGPLYDAAVVYVVPQYTISFVENANPQHEYFNVPVQETDTYELPQTIDGVNVDYYIVDGVKRNKGDEIGPIYEDTQVKVVPVPYWIVTIDGEQSGDPIEDGKNYTFPRGSDAAKIGYISVNGGPIYEPGATVGPIHENRDYISIDRIDIKKQNGAAMYFNVNDKDNKGIAFGTEFSIYDQKGNLIDKRKNEFANIYKSEGFKVGTLITPYDVFGEFFDGEIDLSSVQKAKDAGHPNYIYNVMNDRTFMRNDKTDANPYETYRAGIVGISDFNIPRVFIARAYAWVETVGGETTDPIYADYSDTRSIKEIATNIKNNGTYGKYENWEQKIIDKCYNYQG